MFQNSNNSNGLKRNSNLDLNSYLICPGFYYIPNFLTPDELEYLKLHTARSGRWTSLSNRRVQRHGGVVTEDGKPMIEQQIPKYLHPLKCRIERQLEELKLSPAIQINHVLVNEYTPGQGIMAHTDGPAYVPIVCTLSTGSGQTLNIRHVETRALLHQASDLKFKPLTRHPWWPLVKHKPKIRSKVYLEPGALNILHGEVYPHLHEIEPVTSDPIGPFLSNYHLLASPDQNENSVITRSTRVSFTFRQVKNVKKIPKFIKFAK